MSISRLAKAFFLTVGTFLLSWVVLSNVLDLAGVGPLRLADARVGTVAVGLLLAGVVMNVDKKNGEGEEG